MKIHYFQDTDTLYLELMDGPVHETIEVNENLIADFSVDGAVMGMTVEHASRAEMNALEMIGFPLQVRAQANP